MFEKSRCLPFLLILILALTGFAAQGQAQSSSVAPGNEITQPLPGDDGGTIEKPAQKLAPNQIMFVVRSEHPKVVDIAFYSDNRRHAWPGHERVYTIRDFKTHHYVLNCGPGEKICYGAGIRGSYRNYWGTGIGNKHRCSNCCYTCNGSETRTIVLNP